MTLAVGVYSFQRWVETTYLVLLQVFLNGKSPSATVCINTLAVLWHSRRNKGTQQFFSENVRFQPVFKDSLSQKTRICINIAAANPNLGYTHVWRRQLKRPFTVY